MAWRGGDHGVDVDEFTVREERGEERHRGVPRSRCVVVYLAGAKVERGATVKALTRGAVPRTAAGRKVGEGTDMWGPGVGETKGEKRGARVRPGQALGCCRCSACWAGPHGRREGGGGE